MTRGYELVDDEVDPWDRRLQLLLVAGEEKREHDAGDQQIEGDTALERIEEARPRRPRDERRKGQDHDPEDVRLDREEAEQVPRGERRPLVQDGELVGHRDDRRRGEGQSHDTV
jgi:hypothetical protein